ncbi:monooxygenase, FAD-binding domain protein [Burkholderia ubonensis MSMB22]|nr:monooxygenase, FAD-binding domain protein [Burkholderia ubonensis MSMB22]
MDRRVVHASVTIGQVATQRIEVRFVAIPEPVEAARTGFERTVERGNQERHEQFARRLVQRHVLDQRRDRVRVERGFVDDAAPRDIAGERRRAAGEEARAQARSRAVGRDQEIRADAFVFDVHVDAVGVRVEAGDRAAIADPTRRQRIAQRAVDGIPRRERQHLGFVARDGALTIDPSPPMRRHADHAAAMPAMPFEKRHHAPQHGHTAALAAQRVGRALVDGHVVPDAIERQRGREARDRASCNDYLHRAWPRFLRAFDCARSLCGRALILINGDDATRRRARTSRRAGRSCQRTVAADCPNRMLRDCSSTTGVTLISFARSYARIVAGRAPIRSNHRARCGKSSRR